MTSRQRRMMRFLVRRLRKTGFVTGMEMVAYAYRARCGWTPEISRRLLKRGGQWSVNRDAIEAARPVAPTGRTAVQ